jgi:hypothetical protein
MSICTYGKAILFSFFIICTHLYADDETHKYDVESGIIFYTITGGAQLTKETNLSIEGSLKLRFKEWGDVKLEEEHVMVLTTGAIKDKQEIQRLEKETNNKVITVDYKNEQLLERKKNNVVSNILKETEGLVQKGEDTISGYPCKIWRGEGIEKCIYKGIVLKQKTHLFGVTYLKLATQIVFNFNASKNNCTMPDYHIHKFGLIKDNIKTKNNAKIENFCKILKEESHNFKEENNFTKVNLDDKERQKFINHIAKDIFKRQKEYLPKLLNVLKEERVCLQKSENFVEANQCLASLSEFKIQFNNIENDYITLWDDKNKEKLLDKIEDKLIYMQSRISCVNRAKNITDLSACMK